MEMADDVTEQDKAATVSKVEVACAAAVSWVIAAKVKTTITASIVIAIMFAVVVTGEAATVTPKPPSSSLQCKVSVVYVVDRSARTVFVIATDKNQVVATIPVGLIPMRIAVTPDGTRAYVNTVVDGGFSNCSVSVIDTVTNSVLTTIPLVDGNERCFGGLAISPDGTRVYVVNLLPDVFPPRDRRNVAMISTIDTVTNQVMFTVPVGTPAGAQGAGAGTPYRMVLHPDGTRAYIGGNFYTLVVFDTVRQLMIDTMGWRTGFIVDSMAITPDGTQIYVGGIGAIVVFNTTINQFKTLIPLPSTFTPSVAVSPDGKRVYVTSYNPGSFVTVIDTTTNLALEHIPIERTVDRALGVVVSVDGTQVYVTDGGRHIIFVIDAATNEIVGDIIFDESTSLSGAMAAAWIPC
jgi:YVTN family beta-propeller protein